MSEQTTTPSLAWDLADRLRKSLRVTGLSVNEMTERLGVHRNTITPWLNGTREPSRRTLIAWVLACGEPITLDWILYGDTGDGPDHPGGRIDTVRYLTTHHLAAA
jgi:transcriptional regulator with XRE-family HTH domain